MKLVSFPVDLTATTRIAQDCWFALETCLVIRLVLFCYLGYYPVSSRLWRREIL
jgi:hypothetical protein